MSSFKRWTLFFALCLWLLPGPLAAWGGQGHRLIAALAESRLEPEVRTRVRAMLDGQSLAAVSNWADDLIDTAACSHTEAWHFINIADGETLETSRRSARGDLVSAIERFEDQLRDPRSTDDERRWALKYLIHLIGDIHQPLHVGRLEDRGGNDVLVEWFGESTNLHLVWDVYLIGASGLEAADLASFVARQDATELARWEGGAVGEWVRESLHYRTLPYRFEAPPRLGEAYLDSNLPTIRLRLAQAGVRLAAFLDRSFSEPSLEAGSPSRAPARAPSSPCAPRPEPDGARTHR